LTNGYPVLQEQVGVEELVSLGWAVRWRMGEVVFGLLVARLGAEACVESTALESLETHVGVCLVAIKGSVVGLVSEVGGFSVTLEKMRRE